MFRLEDEVFSVQKRSKGVVFAEWFLLASRLIALATLAIYLPVLVGVGLLVLASSPGPAFVKKAYRRRGGKGELVYLYEFRTECWQSWRETRLGAWLRLMDIHRLPRIANVLLGEVHVGERVQRATP